MWKICMGELKVWGSLAFDPPRHDVYLGTLTDERLLN